MKKCYLFLISILIILFSIIPVRHAKAIENRHQNYWTLEEILVLREKAKQEIFTVCQNSPDPECMERYHSEETSERGTNYQAVDNINVFRFLITAVNPAQNTVRLMFLDDDVENAYVTGELINDNINELYMFWFDWGFLGYDFYNEYQTGTLPSQTHLLFARNSLAASFLPKTEITYELDGSVSENYRNMIYYFFITENGNRYMDPIDYNSCIDHPDYHEGMECRLFFDKNSGGDFVYLPVKISIDTDVQIDSENTNQSTDAVLVDQESASSSTSLPLAPNTGAESRELNSLSTTCERRIEFPWWIILLIAAGEILTLWFLLPDFQKFRRNRKKI